MAEAQSLASTRRDDLDAIAREVQSDGKKRSKRIVPARAGMEGVEEQLRAAIWPRRNRGVTRSHPFARGFKYWCSLLGIGTERMIRDRNPDAIGRRRKVIAGVEQPVAILLIGDERSLDQMSFPILVVLKYDGVLSNERAAII